MRYNADYFLKSNLIKKVIFSSTLVYFDQIITLYDAIHKICRLTIYRNSMPH